MVENAQSEVLGDGGEYRLLPSDVEVILDAINTGKVTLSSLLVSAREDPERHTALRSRIQRMDELYARLKS